MPGYDNPPKKNLSQAEYDALLREIERGIPTLEKTKPHCRQLYSGLYDKRAFNTADPSFRTEARNARIVPADMREAKDRLNLFLSKDLQGAIDFVSQLLTRANEEVNISQKHWEQAGKPPRDVKFDSSNSAIATEYFGGRRKKYQILFALHELKAYGIVNKPGSRFDSTNFGQAVQAAEQGVQQISHNQDVRQYLNLLVADIRQANPTHARNMEVDLTPLRAKAILGGIKLTACVNPEYLEELVLHDLVEYRAEMNRLNSIPQSDPVDESRTAQKLRITIAAAKALSLEK